MTAPVQLPLFGPVAVHVGRWSPVAGFLVCVLCGVSMAMTEVWADCDCCPGWVEPAPLWTLGGSEAPAAPLPSVAAALEEAAA